MGPVVLGETEAGCHVLSEHGVFLVLDILDESIVHGLVGSSALGVNDGLLAILEKLVVSLLALAVADEVLVGHLGGIDTLEVDLGAGCDGVDLVDALKGNAVDLVGTGNKQETRFELLKENNTLSTESTSEQNQD